MVAELVHRTAVRAPGKRDAKYHGNFCGASVWLLCAIAGCSGEPFTADKSRETVMNSGGADGDAGRGSSGSAASIGSSSKLGQVAGSGGRTNPDSVREGGAPTDVDTSESAGGSSPDDSTGGFVEANAGAGSNTALGSAGAPNACLRRVDGAIQAAYFPDIRLATTQDIHPFFQILGSEQPVALERISLRYFFTNEAPSAEVATCYFLTGNSCKSVLLSFANVADPTSTATRVLAVHFAAGTGLSVGLQPIELHLGFAAGSAWLRQTNDYSFDTTASPPTAASPAPYKRWERVLVYVDDQLVWGAEPCWQPHGASAQL